MSITGTRQLARSIEGQGSLPSLSGTRQIARAISPFRPSIGGFRTLARSLSVQVVSITLVLDGAPTGLVGTLTVAITTLDGSAYVYAPSPSHIVEVPAGTGRYEATVPRPDIGRYFVVWSDGITTATLVELDIDLFGVNATHLRVVKAPVQPLDDGDLMEFVVTVSDHAGAAVDPEILTLRISPPDGADVVYTYGVDSLVSRDSVGVYRAAVPVFGEDLPPGSLTRRLGSWRWESSGDYQDAEEGQFLLRRSLVGA